ncbi:hypothetical protein HaLaN_32576, partial [Haematococcus lacustris]
EQQQARIQTLTQQLHSLQQELKAQQAQGLQAHSKGTILWPPHCPTQPWQRTNGRDCDWVHGA